jgi:hypothetical protein
MITTRLILMRELLADTGSIYVHLDITLRTTSRLRLMRFSVGSNFGMK